MIEEREVSDGAVPKDVVLEGADEAIVDARDELRLQCLVHFVPSVELVLADLVRPEDLGDYRSSRTCRDRV